MQQRYLFGVPVQTISELVSDFMAMQGNDRQNHVTDYLICARHAWKDVMKTTIWNTKQVVVEVDTISKTALLPGDRMRLLGISVQDECGKLHQLGHDSNISTVKIDCVTKCSCGCEGVGTLCYAFDNIQLRTVDVIINDNTYVQRIWTRKESNGDVYEVWETPAYDPTLEMDNVQYVTSRKLICQLDVNDKGCVTVTEVNKDKIREHFGCYMPLCGPKLSDVAVRASSNSYGYYNEDADRPNLVHFKGLQTEKVIVSYQTNGESPNLMDEMVVPDFATECFLDHLDLWIKKYAPRYTKTDRAEAKNTAEFSKKKMMKFMNPINIDDFVALSSRLPLW